MQDEISFTILDPGYALSLAPLLHISPVSGTEVD